VNANAADPSLIMWKVIEVKATLNVEKSINCIVIKMIITFCLNPNTKTPSKGQYVRFLD